MQPYNELTRLGRRRRMRQLAKAALEAYGLGGASLRFFYEAGNTLYRVYDPNPESTPAYDDLFESGRYLLRVYQPGWQSPAAIELELAWLSAGEKPADSSRS